MSQRGKNTKSIRKKTLSNTRDIVGGVKSIKFHHEASAGELFIDLTSLVIPSGYVNPSPTELLKARVRDFSENLILTSDTRTDRVQLEVQDYEIVTNTSIRLNVAALEGEIFTGTFYDHQINGTLIADVRAPNYSGVLIEDQTDFALGEPVLIADFSSQWPIQLFRGAGGKPMLRNAGNAEFAGDHSIGNYQMLDNGDGYCSVVRFNIAGDVDDEPVMWASHGSLAERPNLSVLQSVDTVYGIVSSMKEDLLLVTGNDIADPLKYDGTPTNPDLKAFGDRVLTLEKLFDAQVPVLSSWASFTPTGTYTTNTLYTGVWRRVGDNFEAEVKLSFSGLTNVISFLGINMPFGLVIDFSKITDATSKNNVRGDSYFVDQSLLDTYFLLGLNNNSTNVQFAWHDDATKTVTNLSNVSPVTINTGDYAFIRISVPIVGWDATQTLAQQLGL